MSKNTQKTIEELSKDEPDWLTDRRSRAFSSYKNLPDPKSISTPGNVWTDISKLSPDLEDFDRDKRNVSEDKNASIVQLGSEDDGRIKEDIGRVISWDENSYTALNSAFLTDLVFIRVPKGEKVSIDTTSNVDGERFSHTIIIAEQNSNVTVSERFKGSGYLNNIVEVIAEDGAELNYGALQSLDEDSRQFALKRGVAKRDASVNWLDGCFGTGITKSTIETRIEGQGAETKNYGVFFGLDNQHFDLETRTRHEAPDSVCDMFSRGVLDDRAVAAYEGTIEVDEDAPRVDAYQTENVLLISEESEADASPRLEIDNHDVKCSHAATVGQVDEEDLFYMGSRGIDREEARRRIVEGFFEPTLLSFDGFEEEFREEIKNKT